MCAMEMRKAGDVDALVGHQDALVAIESENLARAQTRRPRRDNPRRYALI